MRRLIVTTLIAVALMVLVIGLLSVVLPRLSAGPAPTLTPTPATDTAKPALAYPTTAPPTPTAAPILIVSPAPDWLFTLDDPDLMQEIVFSRDGSLLATGQRNGSVIVWDMLAHDQKMVIPAAAPTTEPLPPTQILPPEARIAVYVQIAFSPDGNLIAMGKGWAAGEPGDYWEDGRSRIEIWDASTGEYLRTLPGEGGYYQLSFSPDGSVLASNQQALAACSCGVITLWDTSTWTVRAVLEDASLPVFMPDSRTLITKSGGSLLAPDPFVDPPPLKFWDVAAGELIRTWEFEQAIYGIALSPDGSKLLVSLDEDGDASTLIAESVIIDPLTGNVLLEAGIVPNSTPGFVFSPDGSLLAQIGSSNTILLFDPATGSALGILSLPSDVLIKSFSFNPDGSLLAVATSDGRILFWQVDGLIN